MTFYTAKGQLHCSAKTLFWPNIQRHNSGAEEQIVTIFHMWPDAELVTLISGSHLKTADIDLCRRVEHVWGAGTFQNVQLLCV